MSLYLGDTPIANNAVSRNVGEIIQSTIPLSDAGLHLLDGALINGAGSYAKFVNYIAGLVSNYPDLFTTEANWQSSVSTYGVCGKFVYDNTNNTVRLPKITGFTEGTTDVTALGDLVEAGLPNITGKFTLFATYGAGISSGALNATFAGTTKSPNNLTGTGDMTVNFNASSSSSIYGNSTTVQPQSIKVLYYIVIASSITNELNLDVADLERSKADVDLSNVNASGTSLASGWGMPSSRYIDLTIGASGATYTAPANGYFQLAVLAGSTIQFYNNTRGGFWKASVSNGSGAFAETIECQKGDTVQCYYDYTTFRWFRFYYTEGENV